jgi:hypothetical protein
MIVAVMQPYFFPYLGYFDLIAAVDLWITLDTVQYIRRGWMNRNRILHPTGGWQYIHVPVAKHDRATKICDMHVAADEDWRDYLLRQLDHYRRHAPFFDATQAMVRDCLARPSDSLGQLNVTVLERCCSALGLTFQHAYLSELGLPLRTIHRSDDWALGVCEALGATKYINPPGGRAIYDAQRFRQHGIELQFQEPLEFRYECQPYVFESGLSIVDVCMWNSVEQLRRRWRDLGSATMPVPSLNLADPRVDPTTHLTMERPIG